ncbi:MAG: porphobilinogen synthase [Thermoplasmataceae archaeon]
MFPVTRMRRTRRNEQIRDLFSEVSVDRNRMVMPVFIDETINGKEPISSMPGIFRYSYDSYKQYITDLDAIGVKSVLFFGIPKLKDSIGSAAYDSDGIVQRSIAYAKENTDLVAMADLCMCEYTDHGHCGILSGTEVDNDNTLESYRKIAKSYAQAGVDVIAPSGMMDGQVGEIRDELDLNGFKDTIIMAYSSKFASSMYGPFRDAAQSTPGFGDRKSYQMDFRNSDQAMREIELDIYEGADIVMIKPALFYLDLIERARSRFEMPIAAYNVSGEYSMIKNAISSGLVSESVIGESLTSIFRAGADIVISYFTESLYRSKA